MVDWEQLADYLKGKTPQQAAKHYDAAMQHEEDLRKERVKMAIGIGAANVLKGMTAPGPTIGVRNYPGGTSQAPSEQSCNVSQYMTRSSKVADPLRLLMGRLRLNDIPANKVECMNIVVMPTKTFVSMYIGDEMTVLEDVTSLFPSDNLVTKLRLLLG